MIVPTSAKVGIARFIFKSPADRQVERGFCMHPHLAAGQRPADQRPSPQPPVPTCPPFPIPPPPIAPSSARASPASRVPRSLLAAVCASACSNASTTRATGCTPRASSSKKSSTRSPSSIRCPPSLSARCRASGSTRRTCVLSISTPPVTTSSRPIRRTSSAGSPRRPSQPASSWPAERRSPARPKPAAATNSPASATRAT